jgi:uncharacterized protein (DUF433 family)
LKREVVGVNTMYEELITRNPDILGGKPILKGTRISVEFILNLLSSGWSSEKILEEYTHLTREGILGALEYAWQLVDKESPLLIETV